MGCVPRGEREMGGVGTTAREPAGWCAATLRTYTLVAYTSADVRDFFLVFCVRTTFLSGRLSGREVEMSKIFFLGRVQARVKGMLGRGRGGGREKRDQDLRVCQPEREEGEKDL